MFCSNCGKNVTGNFWSYCGERLVKVISEMKLEINSENEPEALDTYIIVNNIEINISDIISACGKNKVKAIKLLRARTGVGISEGKNIIDRAYQDIERKAAKIRFTT